MRRIPAFLLDEQRRIVAYLDSIQARLASLRELQSHKGMISASGAPKGVLREGVAPAFWADVVTAHARYVVQGRTMMARVDGLREVQSHKGMISAGGEELRPFFGRTLMPSVLDKAFKGEL